MLLIRPNLGLNSGDRMATVSSTTLVIVKTEKPKATPNGKERHEMPRYSLLSNNRTPRAQSMARTTRSRHASGRAQSGLRVLRQLGSSTRRLRAE